MRLCVCAGWVLRMFEYIFSFDMAQRITWHFLHHIFSTPSAYVVKLTTTFFNILFSFVSLLLNDRPTAAMNMPKFKDGKVFFFKSSRGSQNALNALSYCRWPSLWYAYFVYEVLLHDIIEAIKENKQIPWGIYVPRLIFIWGVKNGKVNQRTIGPVSHT